MNIWEHLPLVAGQAITFLFFVTILRIFAWKPILKLLDDRRERIQSEFDEIASMKKDVETLKEDYEKRVSTIEDEAREKIQGASGTTAGTEGRTWAARDSRVQRPVLL